MGVATATTHCSRIYFLVGLSCLFPEPGHPATWLAASGPVSTRRLRLGSTICPFSGCPRTRGTSETPTRSYPGRHGQISALRGQLQARPETPLDDLDNANIDHMAATCMHNLTTMTVLAERLVQGNTRLGP